MGRFDDAILDCKVAIVNDPDVCIFNHLLQDLYLNLILPRLNDDAADEELLLKWNSWLSL